MAPFHIVSCVFTFFCCARAEIMTVTFNGPVEITCNDNKVIDIVNMTVSESATNCSHDSCSLDDEDKEEIQHKCNGHSSCNISSNLQTNCLKDYGYFSFDYICQEILPLSCDFEQGLCGWTVHNDSTYIWTTTTGTTWAYDHTLGTYFGTYIYADTSEGSPSDKSFFTSAFIQPSKKHCLTFWYYVYGDDSELNLYYTIDDGKSLTLLYTAPKSNETKWYNQILSLPNENRAYRIGFVAVRGQGWGYIALDDIVIANKDCRVSGHDCSFETDCTWSTNRYGYRWRTREKKTNTKDTGPDNDHTTGLSNLGKYIYLEATNRQPGQMANLTIADVPHSDKTCLTFWYHMYGEGMGQLQVYIGEYSNATWSKSGDQGNYWHQAYIDIVMSDTYKVVFRGLRGTNRRSDIALDDMYFIEQTCAEFKRALSHLTMETIGVPRSTETSINVKPTPEIQQCSNEQVQFYEGNLAFSPTYEKCLNIYDSVRNTTKYSCSKMRPSEICSFNFLHFLQENSSCFMLNRLMVNYVCKDLPVDTKELQSHNSASATIGGVIAGVIILACAVIVLMFVFRRSKHCKKESKPPMKLQNNTVNLAAAEDYRSDYTGNQDIALSNASGHVIQLAMVKDGDQQYDEIGSIRNEEHTYTDIDKMTEEQTRPQYEYVDSEINGCIKRNKQDRSNVNCYPSSKDIESENNKSHYSFAKEVNLESNITEDYAVLDPNETGFNRSNVITDVEIDAYNKPDRSTNMENDLTTEMEDQYDVSKDGTYDASNNKHHKETENNVYSHTVDSVYDTSSHKRAKQENENAYDHFFEDRSADNNA